MQWLGYIEPTWEPAENLEHADQALRAYKGSSESETDEEWMSDGNLEVNQASEAEEETPCSGRLRV